MYYLYRTSPYMQLELRFYASLILLGMLLVGGKNFIDKVMPSTTTVAEILRIEQQCALQIDRGTQSDISSPMNCAKARKLRDAHAKDRRHGTARVVKADQVVVHFRYRDPDKRDWKQSKFYRKASDWIVRYLHAGKMFRVRFSAGSVHVPRSIVFVPRNDGI